MIQNANKLPAGKTCPKVDGKAVVHVMQAVIGDEGGRKYLVLLETGAKATVAEADLVDVPNEGEEA